MTVQPDAAPAKVPQVDVVAAVRAGEERIAGEPQGGGGQLLRGRGVESVLVAVHAQLHQPVEDVPAAVPARRLRTGGYGQVDLAAGCQELLGDLAARLPRPHNQHGAVRQLARVAVIVGVKLQDVPGQLCGQRRDFRLLEAAGGQDHVAGAPGTLGGFDVERPAVRGGDAGDVRAGAHRRADGPRILPEIVHHVIARHKGIRVRPRVGHARQHQRDIRGVQAERVPPVLPPTAQGGAPFQDLMLDAGPAQPVAHGQSRLASAYYQSVYLGGHAPARVHGGTIRPLGTALQGFRRRQRGQGGRLNRT